jgi:hypothetical protein
VLGLAVAAGVDADSAGEGETVRIRAIGTEDRQVFSNR